MLSTETSWRVVTLQSIMRIKEDVGLEISRFLNKAFYTDNCPDMPINSKRGEVELYV